MKQCYSSDEENYSHDSAAEAAEDLWSSGGYEAGDTAIVWEAEAVQPKASHLVPNTIADQMCERAHEVCGDFAETWGFSKEEEASLQAAVEKAVDAWADANKKHPDFYGVRNSRPVQVRFINGDGECEVVPESSNQPTA